MKKYLFMLVLLVILTVNVIATPYFKLTEVQVGDMDMLYLTIFNTTTIPDMLIELKGTNLTFNLFPTHTVFKLYTGTSYAYAFNDSDAMILFTAGTILPAPSIYGCSLLYRVPCEKYGSNWGIELKVLRDFNIGGTEFEQGMVLTGMGVPEPTIIVLLSLGCFVLRTKSSSGRK